MARSPGVAPSGDVSFVFSDIEGSTALFRRLGDRYAIVLEEHREILRAAWERHDGYEVGTEGDSFFVAFADASKAVEACLDAQRGLAEHDWGDDPVRVRMGVHRGRASPRSGDYVALAVHQAARIAGAAAGSQVLLTPAVVDAFDADHGIELEPLGAWRVRDFDQPVELWCLTDDRARLVAREPKLLPAAGHNLVRPLDRFIGRDAEGAALDGMIDAGNLVSIVGPAGVGKTRLAVEFGLRNASAWPGGVWFVPLDSVTDPAQVEQTVASVVMHQTPESSGETWSSMLERLTELRALLVLDNCEHVADAVAEAVGQLLVHCAGVGIVVTSREPLGRSAAAPLGERVLRITPLPTRALDGLPPAAEMFVERADVSMEELGDDGASSVIELCDQLDGLPLAIELAASWVELLTPAEIADALADPAASLDARDRRRSDRHRTLTRALDWSYESLDDEARRALRRISVFAGDFSLETAAVVVRDDPAGGSPSDVHDVRLVLHDLVTKSLLDRTRQGRTSRFALLHTVRTYAAGRCSPAERDDAYARLGHEYVSVLGPERSLDRRWLTTVSTELDNLLAVISVDQVDPDTRQQLMWSVGYYRDMTDQYATGLDELERHLRRLETVSSARVALLTLAADLAMRIGDLDLARQYCVRAGETARQHGPPDWDDAGLYRTKAALALWDGDAATCAEIAEIGLEAGLSRRGMARLRDVRGIARVQLGDIQGATEDFLVELELWTALVSDTKACTTHGNLAEVYLQLGDHTEAARHQLACFELAHEFGQHVWIAHSMVMAAHLAAASEDWEVAVRLQQAADVEIERIGFVLFESDVSARRELLESAARVLGDAVVAHILDDVRDDDRGSVDELVRRRLASSIDT